MRRCSRETDASPSGTPFRGSRPMTTEAPASSGSGNSAPASGPSMTVSFAIGSPPAEPLGDLPSLLSGGDGQGPPAIEAPHDHHALEGGPGVAQRGGGPELDDAPAPVGPLDERALPSPEAVD